MNFSLMKGCIFLLLSFSLQNLRNTQKKYKKKTEKTEEELNHLLDVLKMKIILIPLEEILPYLDEAEKISPDPDDVAYFALALKLKCAIWSQDRKLRENQNKVQVYSTEDLVRMF